MPLHTSVDSKGRFYQFGNLKKYYGITGRYKALKQARAVELSKKRKN